MSTPRILIIGAGIAGLLLATRLGRTLGRRGEARITLVDRSFHHIWKPTLHTIAAGTQSAHHQAVNLLAHAAGSGYAFEPGELQAVDRARREVWLATLCDEQGREQVPARALPYDWLVLALGSGANDFGVTGVREHAQFIDGLAQAEQFNQALRRQLLRAALKDEPLRVSIVGGGATGVELAAELSHVMELAAGYGDPGLRERLQLTLYDSGPRLLGAFPPAISSASQAVLERLGFRLHLGARVQGVTATGLSVRQADGTLQQAPSDLRVWAAGVQAPAAMAALQPLPLNALRQLLVTAQLCSPEDERVLALGDCAACTPPGAERPLPPTAQIATQQAHYLALALPARLRGQTSPDFRARDLGALVSLGAYNAYGTLGASGLLPGRFIRGRLAQWAHAGLHARHQAAVQGLGRAALGWLAEALHRRAGSPVRLG